jgi:N-acyl-D-aspartate/D-glutamate deacylase
MIRLFFLLLVCSAQTSAYDLVISNGRVIDPETGLDAMLNVAIEDGTISALSAEGLEGDRHIDATGLVVAPGFIDLHTHSPTQLGQYYQLFDGVTTALELEAGMYPASDYGAEVRDGALINYGASAGYIGIRLLVKNSLRMSSPSENPTPDGLAGWWTYFKFIFQDFQTVLAPTFSEQASSAEIARMRQLLESDLDEGAIGIGLALDYISEAVNDAELKMIFSVAGERQAPLFVHVRRGVNGDPSGLREVLSLAEQTNAPVHICHITHNAMGNVELFLREVREAQGKGVDVTVGVLPYNAGSTAIGAAVFSRDWQTIFDISYEDVEWAATGERFDKVMWEKYREEQPSGAVIHHYLREEWTRRALLEPGSIVVSDLIPMKSLEEKVPPHNGAFSKILARYVREQNALDLMDALGKMTVLPARRLQNYAPAFARKGRVQPGMDADLVIFDPDLIEDRASYRDPYQTALGIEHVVVAGIPVISNAKLLPNASPGRYLSAKNQLD